MQKIYIKYDPNNWAEIKKAVDLIRSTGQTVVKRKDAGNVKDKTATGLTSMTATGAKWSKKCWDYGFISEKEYKERGFEILEMPRDMKKLEELLGVEKPKFGDIMVASFDSRKVIYRWSTEDIKPSIINSDGIFMFNCEAVTGTNIITDKATTEEAIKLIETEHKNEYHWDGKELVKIPEMVRFIGGSNLYFTNGVLYKLIKIKGDKASLMDKFGTMRERFIKDCDFNAKIGSLTYELTIDTSALEIPFIKAENGVLKVSNEYLRAENKRLETEGKRLKTKLNEIKDKCDS